MARKFASELFIGHPGGDAGKGCRTPNARLRDGAARQVRQQAAFGAQNPIELCPAAPGNDVIGWARSRTWTKPGLSNNQKSKTVGKFCFFGFEILKVLGHF